MTERIFVVEDDDSIRMLLEAALHSQGYEVEGFFDGASMLKRLEQQKPDLAILDIMLEGIDGISILKLMRQSPQLSRIPVMMLTAKSTETDKITGLDSGADDYMTKPFSVLELCARVRALLRRSGEAGGQSQGIVEGGDIKINKDTREAFVCGKSADLTFKEFELLRMLMENRNRAVSREELLEKIWGIDFCGETRTLDIHVGTLRHKLKELGGDRTYIKTVRGVGYRFTGGEEKES